MAEQLKPTGQKHILVVDDNVDLAQTYEELFQAYGYKVSVATNGVLALKMVVAADVDAILCDLSMPQLQGDMFYQTVERARPHLSGRFIFVTGNDGNPAFQQFLSRVKVPVLIKPVSIDKLLEALRTLFAAQEA